VAARQQDVLRFDVAVDHPAAVGVAQRVRHFPRDLEGVAHRELLLPMQAVAQGFALDQGHDVIQGGRAFRRRDFSAVQQGQDVGMVQLGRDGDFAQEALGPQDGRPLGPQDLDGDPTLVPDVLREVHDRHAPLPQHLEDPVVPGQRFIEAGDQLIHARRLPLGRRYAARSHHAT
jgi:hypothetical protein